MNDPINQMLDANDKLDERYNQWVEDNEEYIIDMYAESINYIDDVPEDYIQGLYENSFEPDYDGDED